MKKHAHTKLGDLDAARLLLKFYGGDTPPNNIASILPGDWLDGVSAGLTGQDGWLAAVTSRDPARGAEIRAALEATSQDPLGYSDPSLERPRLPEGTRVKALDRDNFGFVVEDRGDEIEVIFRSPEGSEAKKTFRETDLRLADGSPLDVTNPEPAQPFDLKILSNGAFILADYRREWLIRGVLVRGRAGVVGGPQKSMKTSTTVDLMVSLACGVKFFGSFEVPQPTKVLLISGESGAAVVQETCRRVCKSKGINPYNMEEFAYWGFDLPRLDSPEQLGALAKFIRENGIEVVILDPLYLCLLTGGHAIDPANLFDVGPLLKTITTTCLDAGATPLLVHHFRKNRENPNGPPELEDLSFAGIQEFARQWLLINRRERYEPGSGLHRLWFSVGGSDGHSGEWAVDISEGTVDAEFKDREWNVTINRAADARDEVKQRHEASKAAKAAEAEKKKVAADERRRCDAIEAALAILRKSPSGLTKSKWRDAIGCNGAKLNAMISTLIDQGRIRESTVTVAGSKGKTWTNDSYIFVTHIVQETTLDNPGQPRTIHQLSIAGPGLTTTLDRTLDTPPLTGGVQGPSGVSCPDLSGSTADKTTQTQEKSPGLVDSVKGVA